MWKEVIVAPIVIHWVLTSTFAAFYYFLILSTVAVLVLQLSCCV